MKMTIGANIKRLRTGKGETQEQLSEAMNVTCAAVSKWERGETYPDITLLQPLAFHFGVTLDELMGYDRERISAEIDGLLSEYEVLRRNDGKKAGELICKAFREYPNDYRVMSCYMWDAAGGTAENNHDALNIHREEFLAICDKLLDDCTDEHIRLNAWNMRAKMLHAEGRTDEAIAIYQTRFADWFNTVGQKCEQLFKKDDPEFIYWVRRNMFELADFAADKLAKSCFFDERLSMNEKVGIIEEHVEAMLKANSETGETIFTVMARTLLGRLLNDLHYRGGDEADISRVTAKHLAAAKLMIDASQCDRSLSDYITGRFGSDDPLKWNALN